MSVLDQPMVPFTSYRKQADERWIALLAHYGVDRNVPNWKDQLLFEVVRERWPGFSIAAVGKPRTVRDPWSLRAAVLAIRCEAEPQQDRLSDSDFAAVKQIRAELARTRRPVDAVLKYLSKNRNCQWYGMAPETLRTVFKKMKTFWSSRARLPADQKDQEVYMWLHSDIRIAEHIKTVTALPVGQNPLANYITQN